jgi:hypothetical protein
VALSLAPDAGESQLGAAEGDSQVSELHGPSG